MDTTLIDYEVERRNATITLGRAGPARAQTVPMLDDFDEAFTAVQSVGIAVGVLPAWRGARKTKEDQAAP